MDIETKEICKIYPLKTALDKTSVKFSSGKIHALLGENGAGKSTLASIISGYLKATSGKLFLDNREVDFQKPSDAISEGIVIVRQVPLLAEEITGEENIIISSNKKNILGDPDFIKIKKKWAPLLNLKCLVKNTGGNERFYISLLQALIKKNNVIILDEPSAFLDQEERERLFQNLHQEAEDGKNIIVITHSKAEALNYCDDITFLKKGANTSDTAQNYINREIQISKIDKTEETREEKLFLEFKDLECRSKTKPALLKVSFKSFYGNICAICGLNEPSMVTLEDIVTGMDTHRTKGLIKICCGNNLEEIKMQGRMGKKWQPSFLRKNRTAIVPSDRMYRASNPKLTVEQMLTALQGPLSAEELIQKAGVKIGSQEKCSSLSGGMLQRLILERELSLDPQAIILCNPMQALDIEAQGQLCKKLEKLAQEGKAILIIGAAEFPLTLCQRVYNLDGGICSLSFQS